MAYQIAALVHVLSAITWVGGVLFITMVLTPLSRRERDSPTQAAYFLLRAGLLFRPAAWIAIVLLVLSGIYLAESHWQVSVLDLFTQGGRFVHVLQAKVGLAVIAIALSAIHDFRLAPRAMKRLEGLIEAGGVPADEAGAPKSMVRLSRINAALIAVVVALAVTLTRGSLF